MNLKFRVTIIILSLIVFIVEYILKKKKNLELFGGIIVNLYLLFIILLAINPNSFKFLIVIFTLHNFIELFILATIFYLVIYTLFIGYRLSLLKYRVDVINKTMITKK